MYDVRKRMAFHMNASFPEAKSFKLPSRRNSGQKFAWPKTNVLLRLGSRL